MLRKIIMVGLMVVGLAIAGLSVASGTVWRPSDTVVMTTTAQPGSTLLTTAPGVLGLVDKKVTITASSSPDSTVVLAMGSAVDVAGWVGDDPSTTVTGAADWDTLAAATSAASPTPEASADATTAPAADATDPATDPATDATDPAADATDPAADATDPAADATDPAADATDPAPDVAAPTSGPDPSGSDMWLTTVSGTGSATLEWVASSSDQVLLVAAVGDDAAAPTLSLTWPREVTTPLMWPGTAVGLVLVLAGILFGLFFVRHRRPAKGSDGTSGEPTPDPTSDQADADLENLPSAGLTRRELRERQERIDAAKLAAEKPAEPEPAKKPKRQWPWTGAIATVKPAPEPEKAPEADPKRPAWLPEGTASTSASSWRQNWGVRPESAAPRPETGAVPTGFPARGSLTNPVTENAAARTAAGLPTRPQVARQDPSAADASAPHPTAPAPVQAYLRRSGLGGQPAGQVAAGRSPDGTTAAPTGSATDAPQTRSSLAAAFPRTTAPTAGQPTTGQPTSSPAPTGPAAPRPRAAQPPLATRAAGAQPAASGPAPDGTPESGQRGPATLHVRRSQQQASAVPTRSSPAAPTAPASAHSPATSVPAAPPTGSQPLTRRAIREGAETGATQTVPAGQVPPRPVTAPTMSPFSRSLRRSLGTDGTPPPDTTTTPDTTKDGE